METTNQIRIGKVPMRPDYAGAVRKLKVGESITWKDTSKTYMAVSYIKHRFKNLPEDKRIIIDYVLDEDTQTITVTRIA